MAGYAIVWTDSAGTRREVWVGALELDADQARLTGNNGRTLESRTFRRGEIASVSRAPDEERLAGYRALRLILRNGEQLLLASVIGLSARTELLDGLAALVAS